MGRPQDKRPGNTRADAVPDPRGLPMPPTARPSLDEWRDYRGRREFYLARHPGYDDGWRRPTLATAEAVWQLVAPAMGLRLENFMPPSYILERTTAAERAAWRAEVGVTTKQAVAVTLKYAVQVGREPSYVRWDDVTGERKVRRRLVTVTGLFDQLAEHWSDHYRFQRKQYPGIRVRGMTQETAKSCWDDLRRNGIDLEKFWNILVKRRFNPLFRAVWRKNKSGRKKGGRGRGYVIELQEGDALAKFERLLRKDPSYAKPTGRLLLADDPTPAEVRTRQHYAGGRPYDVVELEARSKELIATMGQSRLLFSTEWFREDVQGAQQEMCRLSGKDRETGEARLAAMLPIEAQLREGPLPAWTDPSGKTWAPFALVKSGFGRLINRRYQPKHFWPSEARTELDWTEPRPEREPPDPQSDVYSPSLWRPLLLSARARWWAAESLDSETSIDEDREVLGPSDLVGVDVSSSGTQILAVLLGLEELEALASSRALPFKHYLAGLARQKHEDPADPFTLPARYTGPENNKTLVDAVKKFWMKIMYGASPGKPANRPEEWTEENAVDFLEAVPQYEKIRRYFKACKEIGGKIADKYQGVVFTDPYDGARVRWNPVERVDQVVSRDGVKLILSVPGHFDKKSKRAVPHDAVGGEYPVRRGGKRGLSLRVAPCLVHMLDAYFASLVVEQLAAHGVRDFVSIHDGWLVPEAVRDQDRPGYWRSGAAVLKECVAAAGEPWLSRAGCGLRATAGLPGPPPGVRRGRAGLGDVLAGSRRSPGVAGLRSEGRRAAGVWASTTRRDGLAET